MKIIPLYLLLTLISSFQLYSEDEPANVETPIGSEVEAWDMDESSAGIRSSTDDFYSRHYQYATQIETYDGYSSTQKFNCHGYAWYMMSDAGGNDLEDPRWIGTSSTQEDIYMTDGSYKEVPAQVYPGKVSYLGIDHSAITTPFPGKFRSKWGPDCLMEHEWDNVPYEGITGLKYYQLCYEGIIDETITSDLTKVVCGLLFEDVTIQNNADVDIEFEVWVKIEGPFEITSGSTLDIVPE